MINKNGRSCGKFHELLQKIEKENMGFIRLLLVTVKKICLE